MSEAVTTTSRGTPPSGGGGNSTTLDHVKTQKLRNKDDSTRHDIVDATTHEKIIILSSLFVQGCGITVRKKGVGTELSYPYPIYARDGGGAVVVAVAIVAAKGGGSRQKWG